MAGWLRDTLLSGAGSVIDGWAWLSREASEVVINSAVGVTRNRPHPWSTHRPYTTWEGLTDRTCLGRHLPPADAPVQPSPEAIRALFRRVPGRQTLSKKSTCLFPAFAQYLTDGFIRTSPKDVARTTSNHEIDLCPLYGLIPSQTAALRLGSEAVGRRGRLKSQMVGAEEFPPFLYERKDVLTDPAFGALDPPLMGEAELPADRLRTLFAVGGDRANSTPFTAMMNTLLLREHNRIAGKLERKYGWDDDRVFETARNIVIALFIKIVVEDYINHITPLPFALRAHPSVAWHADWNRPNRMTVEFSLLYRWHSLMPDTIEWPSKRIPLGEFTLNNRPLLDVGLDAAFAAAAAQPAGALGPFNTGDALLRIEDLAVQQARRNRLDTYNQYRRAFGMEAAASFKEISSDPAVAGLLKDLYRDPEHVEFYPGLFAEDRVEDSPLPGLLLRMVAVDAFSQALTNPLLSEHVWNADTFSPWGFELLQETGHLGTLLARNVQTPSGKPIEMTQASWRYTDGP